MWKFKLFLAGFVIFSTVGNIFVEGANILAIFPGSIRSHFLIGKVLFKELADRGHKITLISPFTITEPIDGIDEINLIGVQQIFEGNIVKC